MPTETIFKNPPQVPPGVPGLHVPDQHRALPLVRDHPDLGGLQLSPHHLHAQPRHIRYDYRRPGQNGDFGRNFTHFRLIFCWFSANATPDFPPKMALHPCYKLKHGAPSAVFPPTSLWIPAIFRRSCLAGANHIVASQVHGHLRYCFIFLLMKSDFFCIFHQVYLTGGRLFK